MTFQRFTTVVDCASSYDLTTLANLKAEFDFADTTKDALLRRYITMASAAAAQFCNRVFPTESISDRFLPVSDNGSFSARVQPLQLARWPVVEITSVTENAVALTADTDFIVDVDAGQLTRLDSRGCPTHWASSPVIALYDGGYDKIPADVEDAVIRMGSSRYLGRGRDRNVRQENIPGVREIQYWIATGTDAGNLSPDIEDILENYRTPVIA